MNKTLTGCNMENIEMREQRLIPDSRVQVNEEYLDFWKKMTTMSRGSFLKLLHDLANWVVETSTLYFTFGLLVIDGDTGDPDSNTEIKATLIVHGILSIFRLLVDIFNISRPQDKKRTKRKETVKVIFIYFWRFIANLFMVMSPIRSITEYNFRSKKIKELKERLRAESLDRGQIERVLELNEQELVKENFNITEVFVQTMPMALFQNYIMFQNNQSFELCSRADASRLFMMLFGIMSASKAMANFDWSYNNYLKSLHFLNWFETRNLNTRVSVEIRPQWFFTFVLNLVTNFFLILHRFYMIAYFLSVRTDLVLVYIITQSTLNWLMLLMWPNKFRVPYENAPFGTITFISELQDRWINLFTNHMTRFSWPSNSFKICKISFRVPLNLYQWIPFIISVSVTFGVVYLTGDDWDKYLLLRSLKRDTSIDNSPNFLGNSSGVLAVPCTNFTVEDQPGFVHSIAKNAFDVAYSFKNRFHSIMDLFGVIYFLPFSMFFYWLFSTTYCYYLTELKIYDENFPVHVAYKFWHFLCTKLIESSRETEIGNQKFNLRKLITLTCMRNKQLYRFYFANFWRQIFCRGQRDHFSDASASLTRGMNPHGLRSEISRLLQIAHPLRDDFVKMHRILNTDFTSESDWKLFLYFLQNFESNMKDMTSFRIRLMFSLLNVNLGTPEDV